jgi:hypothetical protein
MAAQRGWPRPLHATCGLLSSYARASRACPVPWARAAPQHTNTMVVSKHLRVEACHTARDCARKSGSMRRKQTMVLLDGFVNLKFSTSSATALRGCIDAQTDWWRDGLSNLHCMSRCIVGRYRAQVLDMRMCCIVSIRGTSNPQCGCPWIMRGASER